MRRAGTQENLCACSALRQAAKNCGDGLGFYIVGFCVEPKAEDGLDVGGEEWRHTCWQFDERQDASRHSFDVDVNVVFIVGSGR